MLNFPSRLIGHGCKYLGAVINIIMNWMAHKAVSIKCNIAFCSVESN